MKSAGQTDQAIMNALSQQGFSVSEISEAISQADIKRAVVGRQQNLGMTQELDSGEQGIYETPVFQGEQGLVQQRGYEGMQPSMAGGEQVGGYQDYGTTAGAYPAEQPVQGYSSGGGVEQQYSEPGAGYPDYQQYQEGMSSDVITEIAEQIVGERMAQMRENLERVLDFRTVAEAKIEGLNERLRRMEKIIDTLQLSILEKVGEYVGDVKHLKDELIETQKSFRAVNRGKK